MSRITTAAMLLLGIVFGAIAWGVAAPDRYRIVFGVVPVVGMAVLVITLARLREPDRLPTKGAARMLIYCLLSGAIVHIALFSPFVPARAFLVLHLAIVLGAGWLLRRGRAASDGSALPLTADVLIGGCLILIVGSELTLRVWSSFEPRSLFLQRDMSPSDRVAAVRFAPGTSLDGTTVNQDGFRDAPFEHREGLRTVLLLGDRGFALGVAAASAPTSVASVADPTMSFWNATLPHTGPLEAELLFRQLASGTRPDAVIHVLALDDDILDLDRTPAPWTGVALWLDSANVLTALVVWRVLERIDVAAKRSGPESSASRGLSSQLIDGARRTIASLRGEQGRPLIDAAIDVEVRLAEAARELGIGFGVMVLPARYQIDDVLWDALVDAGDRDAPRTDLVHALRAHDIPVGDLTPVFSALPRLDGGREDLYQVDDTALSNHGAQLAGDALLALTKQVLGQAKRSR